MKNLTMHLIVCGLIVSSTYSQSADPDTVYQMPPVLITATKAFQRSNPVTFSNLERGELNALYSTQDIPVLLSDLPSMTTYSENGSGIGYNYINLRGFDQRRISVMINGVPQNDPEDHNVYWVDFPDLLANTQEIQVQRGAGSAFYGPPAIGGSVNLVANPFRPEPSVQFESLFGFQEFGAEDERRLVTRKYSVSINSGWVEDKYLLYGRLGKLKTEGYRDLGWVDLSSYFIGAMRVDEDMTTRFHAFGGPIEDGLAYVGLPRSFSNDLVLRRANYSYWEYDPDGTSVGFSVPQKPTAREKFSQPHYEIIHDWNTSNTVSLHTTLFYVQGDGYFDYDGDWIPYDAAATEWFKRYVGYSPSLGVSQFPAFLIRGAVENRQWGLLPRAEIVHDGGRLTVGIEARAHRSHHYGQIVYTSEAPFAAFDPTSKIYAYDGERDVFSAFIHEIYNLSPSVSVVGDLQLVHNRYGITNEAFLGNSFDLSYTFVNPRAGINVNLSENLHTFGFVGYTSREPRMRNLYAAEDAYFGAVPEFAADTTSGGVKYDFNAPFAKPEHLLNLEWGAGFASTLARLNITAFLMEFTDELVKSGRVDIFGQPVTGNADRTRHLGLEVDGLYTFLPGLSIGGNATISRNRIVSYTTYESGTPVSLDGNVIAGFPDFLSNFRLTYDNGTTFASMSLKYVGEFYTDNTMNRRNRNLAYWTVNFTGIHRLAVTDGITIALRAEVRNLLDELYTTGGEGTSFFPAAERNVLLGISLGM